MGGEGGGLGAMSTALQDTGDPTGRGQTSPRACWEEGPQCEAFAFAELGVSVLSSWGKVPGWGKYLPAEGLWQRDPRPHTEAGL